MRRGRTRRGIRAGAPDLPWGEPRLPALAGSGSSYVIDLDTANFALLVVGLVLFIGMFVLLLSRTKSRRALRGFIDATGVSLAFLVFSLVTLLYLEDHYPSGNRAAWALAQVILQGYWLALAIPIVSVGSSVHSATRGTAAWLYPSVLVSAGLFLVLFYYYFSFLP